MERGREESAQGKQKIWFLSDLQDILEYTEIKRIDRLSKLTKKFASVFLQAVFGFGLMRFTREYRKTPARATPVPNNINTTRKISKP